MSRKELYTLGIDIGSTTVKIALLDSGNEVVETFCKYSGDPVRPFRTRDL